ncbi:MAG: hypothetical protein FWD23_12455 [Oscillospiraceae bacterium]|nr:hypothetical protein [Oscillospiraceae bacterium]
METQNARLDTKKLFDFKFIGIGLIFLMDFNINTIDFLPDFIGLICISAAVGKSFYMNEDLARAKKYINIAYAPALVKFIWNVLFFVLGIKKIESSFLLLFTAVTSGFELVLGILIFMYIFKALDLFFLLGEKIEYVKNSDFILKAIKFFMIFKFVLSLVPLLPVLLTDSAWDSLSVAFDANLNADFIKNLFSPPCFIIQTLTALFLLSIIIPFFFAVAKDNDLYDYIKSKINHVLLDTQFYFFVVKQNLHSAFLLFTLGCLFFMDFLVDDINFLPDFVICALFIPGIFAILKKNPGLKNKKLVIFLSAAFFVSIFAYISGTIYRLEQTAAFFGENVFYLQTLRYLYVILFQVSVILFLFAFLEFYSFILELRHLHFEFSVRYLDKYLTSSEKNYGKNKNKILLAAGAAFCFKTLSVILPQSGIVIFGHSMILLAFVFFAVKGLFSVRDSIYGCYEVKRQPGEGK